MTSNSDHKKKLKNETSPILFWEYLKNRIIPKNEEKVETQTFGPKVGNFLQSAYSKMLNPKNFGEIANYG